MMKNIFFRFGALVTLLGFVAYLFSRFVTYREGTWAHPLTVTAFVITAFGLILCGLGKLTHQ